MLKLAVGTALLTGSAAQLGPGVGPWEVATPESQGLSSDALREADEATESGMGGRVCYVVVKNGKIVHERYMGSGTESGIRSAWSVTKSMCASLFGIAEQQGWANTTDLVRDRNDGTRLCNTEAEFRHVLTMTGTSPDINNPRYSYDTLGINCLDTISDFLAENNPDGVGSGDWMEREYFSKLGVEHSNWVPLAGNLLCGFSADTSCRDLARFGQLWANEGRWIDSNGNVEQLMDEQYSIEGRTFVFPQTSREYGYTLPLSVNDPVDPSTGSMVGLNAQCVQFSPEHNAVVISMGNGGGCGTAWANTRAAIVSSDHPLYNATRHLLPSALPTPSFKEQAAAKAMEEAQLKSDILELAPFMRQHADHFKATDLALFNEKLLSWGEEPITAATPADEAGH